MRPTQTVTGNIRGRRIGVPKNYFFEASDPEVIEAVTAAIAVMQGLGAEVKEIELPTSAYASAASWAIAYTEAFSLHRNRFFERSRDYSPAFLHKITGAALLSSDELLTAQRLREKVTMEFTDALHEVDVIATPTTAYPAHSISGQAPESATHSLTRPVSLTGLPSLVMPCGFAAGGLPISLQLTGRAWEEQTILGVGYAYEQATEWSEKIAPINAETKPPDHLPEATHPSEINANWIMDFARLTGLTFVTEDDAGGIAQSIGPQKTQFRRALEVIDIGLEPAVRPAR